MVKMILLQNRNKGTDVENKCNDARREREGMNWQSGV